MVGRDKPVHGCSQGRTDWTFFECYESIERQNEFVVVETFESPEAGQVHVASAHFREFIEWAPDVVAETPTIVNVEVPAGWSEMAEVKARG